MSDALLPIKVVFARSNVDYVARTETPQQWEPFREVTPELRKQLVRQAQRVKDHLSMTYSDWGKVPGVAKVTLIPQAIAKTYRPKAIFNENTCPILGTGNLGELFISVTPAGIDKLVDRIQHGEGVRATAHISTIERIEPYLNPLSPELELSNLAMPAQKATAKRLRCRLFPFQGADAATSEQLFTRFAQSKGATKVERMSPSFGRMC